MFNWTNTTLPKLLDYFNNTSRNPAQAMVAPWVTFMGGWFFAFIIGVVGAALYTKSKKTLPSIAFIVICNLLLGSVLPTEFVYIVGLLVATSFGLILFKLFIKED